MSKSFLYFYQHLLSYINPDLKIGPLSISWYSIMYLVAFLTVYFLLRYRIKKEETKNYPPAGPLRRSFSEASEAGKLKSKTWLVDFLICSFIGLLIGARLGYVLFYNLSIYLKNPLSIISPIDPVTHQFVGIYGMSYHGGLIGVIVAALIFCKKYRVNFWSLANFVVPAVPAGYFFGRIGNFINGELYGRVTNGWWGMYFPQAVTGRDPSLHLRHPSQLYEAFLEGIVLFIILWSIRNKNWAKDNMLALYLLGYALARFLAEFFREPDEQIGYISGYVTLGQIFSVVMIIFAIILFSQRRKNLV